MGILKEDIGYSAHTKFKNLSIHTQGDNMQVLKTNIVEAVNLGFKDPGYSYTIEEIGLKPDLRSFFG